MKNKDLQLVTFEQAQKLKQAGFDWPCNSWYSEKLGNIHEEAGILNHNFAGGINAPTVALALKWMREVKGIDWQIVWVEIEGVAYAGEIKPLGAEGMVTRVCLESTCESAESALLDELLTIIDNQ